MDIFDRAIQSILEEEIRYYDDNDVLGPLDVKEQQVFRDMAESVMSVLKRSGWGLLPPLGMRGVCERCNTFVTLGTKHLMFNGDQMFACTVVDEDEYWDEQTLTPHQLFNSRVDSRQRCIKCGDIVPEGIRHYPRRPSTSNTTVCDIRRTSGNETINTVS